VGDENWPSFPALLSAAPHYGTKNAATQEREPDKEPQGKRARAGVIY